MKSFLGPKDDESYGEPSNTGLFKPHESRKANFVPVTNTALNFNNSADNKRVRAPRNAEESQTAQGIAKKGSK